MITALTTDLFRVFKHPVLKTSPHPDLLTQTTYGIPRTTHYKFHHPCFNKFNTATEPPDTVTQASFRPQMVVSLIDSVFANDPGTGLPF